MLETAKIAAIVLAASFAVIDSLNLHCGQVPICFNSGQLCPHNTSPSNWGLTASGDALNLLMYSESVRLMDLLQAVALMLVVDRVGVVPMALTQRVNAGESSDTAPPSRRFRRPNARFGTVFSVSDDMKKRFSRF